MTSLVVRRPPFPIDASAPFQWQPANPSFGLFGNTFTFLAIASERYIVAATREAMPRITDPAVAEEADAFLRQEAQHARAHRLMSPRPPGVKADRDARKVKSECLDANGNRMGHRHEKRDVKEDARENARASSDTI